MLIGTGIIRNWMAGNLVDGDKTPNATLFSLSKAVQAFADSYTKRTLEAAHYNSHPIETFFDGNSASWIYTRQYPISSLENIWVDGNRDFDTTTLLVREDIEFYPASGKIWSEAGRFFRGHRNVKIDYKAGYAPVVGGTHDNAVSTYPLPQDLEQVMLEMIVQSLKEGLTAIKTVESVDRAFFSQLLSKNSFWKMTLDSYKSYDSGLGALEE